MTASSTDAEAAEASGRMLEAAAHDFGESNQASRHHASVSKAPDALRACAVAHEALARLQVTVYEFKAMQQFCEPERAVNLPGRGRPSPASPYN